jgi:hypothetical protein
MTPLAPIRAEAGSNAVWSKKPKPSFLLVLDLHPDFVKSKIYIYGWRK